MTANAVSFQQDWANHAAGKVLRVLLALGGLLTATLVVLLATIGGTSAWLLLLLGLGLGVSAVRAALKPTVIRLATTLTAVVAIPLIGFVV